MTEIGPKKFGFSKAERLTGKKKTEELFRRGSSIFLHPFLLKYLPVEENPTFRVLITVPKKKIKRAVDRNLIKRRIREVYRLNKHLLLQEPQSSYHVAIIYQSDEILPFEQIEKNLITLLGRFKKRIDDSDEKN